MFIQDDGYSRPELWLAEAWVDLQQHARRHPLYWRWEDGQWFEYRLDGFHPLVANVPVVHVSGYEAAAFAAGLAPVCPLSSSGNMRRPKKPIPRVISLTVGVCIPRLSGLITAKCLAMSEVDQQQLRTLSRLRASAGCAW